MTDEEKRVPDGLRQHYRDLKMMAQIINGFDYKAIAMLWGVSVAVAMERVKSVAFEIMRIVMANVKANPDHPAPARWTVDEFTKDPRGCMVAMMRDEIRKLEAEWPELKQKEDRKFGDLKGE